MNANILYLQYTYATAYECTPYFGTQNPAGLSDIYDAVTSGGEFGVGAIFTGLDEANSFWDCIRNLEQDYFRGLEALANSIDNCFYRTGCYMADWGMY